MLLFLEGAAAVGKQETEQQGPEPEQEENNPEAEAASAPEREPTKCEEESAQGCGLACEPPCELAYGLEARISSSRAWQPPRGWLCSRAARWF